MKWSLVSELTGDVNYCAGNHERCLPTSVLAGGALTKVISTLGRPMFYISPLAPRIRIPFATTIMFAIRVVSLARSQLRVYLHQ